MSTLNLFDIFLIAAYYSRKAGNSTETSFLSGHNMPWYVARALQISSKDSEISPTLSSRRSPHM